MSDKLKDLVLLANTDIEKNQIEGTVWRKGQKETNETSITLSHGDQRGTGLFGNVAYDENSKEGNGEVFSDEKLENESLYAKLEENIINNRSDSK